MQCVCVCTSLPANFCGYVLICIQERTARIFFRALFCEFFLDDNWLLLSRSLALCMQDIVAVVVHEILAPAR